MDDLEDENVASCGCPLEKLCSGHRAAPDLLDALKDLLEACEAAGHDGSVESDVDGAEIEKARRAIGKAEKEIELRVGLFPERKPNY